MREKEEKKVENSSFVEIASIVCYVYCITIKLLRFHNSVYPNVLPPPNSLLFFSSFHGRFIHLIGDDFVKMKN